jgi:hypothetical protein
MRGTLEIAIGSIGRTKFGQIRPGKRPSMTVGSCRVALRHLAVPSPTVIVGRTRGWRGALSGFKSEVWRS